VFAGTFVAGVSVSCAATECLAVDSKDKSSLFRWS
jgi:hypothetical protein